MAMLYMYICTWIEIALVGVSVRQNETVLVREAEGLQEPHAINEHRLERSSHNRKNAAREDAELRDSMTYGLSRK